MGNSKSAPAKVEPASEAQVDSPGARRASVQAKFRAVMALQMSSHAHHQGHAGPSVNVRQAPAATENAQPVHSRISADSAPDAEPGAAQHKDKVKTFHAAAALSTGSAVMKDPPRNVLGPGYVVSPDVYADMHASGSYDRFLLTFHKLGSEERLACFEEMTFFQGKMGYVLRACDAFCHCQSPLELFEKMREVTACVLDLPHGRLWRLDKQMNMVICQFNNTSDHAQNGRAAHPMPSPRPARVPIAHAMRVVPLSSSSREHTQRPLWPRGRLSRL